MVFILTLLILILFILSFIYRTTKVGVYLFKIVLCFSVGLAILIIYFFSLGSTTYVLNWELHPWIRVLPRLIIAISFAVFVFVVSQLPFVYSKAFSTVLRNKIMLFEGFIYIVFCLTGCVLSYYSSINISAEFRAGNEVVRSIDLFEEKNGRLPDSLGEIGLDMNSISDDNWEYKGQHFYYLHSEKAYSLFYSIPDEDYEVTYTYNSDVRQWSEDSI